MAEVSTLPQTAPLSPPLKVREITVVYLLTITGLYLFFFSDFLNKALVVFRIDYSRASILFRSLYELLFLVVIVMFPTRSRMMFLSLMGILFVTFITGQIVYTNNTPYYPQYFENILLFNKYFFAFIIYFAIYRLADYPSKFQKAIRVMENLFLLNAWCTLAGVVFGIDLFRTYVLQTYRFGYSGILWAQNEASVMYFLSLSHFYYKRYILKDNSKGFFIILIAGVFLGTKALYLFMAMLLVFHFMTKSSVNTKVFALYFVVIVFYSIRRFLRSDTSDQLLAYFVSKAEEHGIWYMLFSGRTMYLDVADNIVTYYWTPVNWLFGGHNQMAFMVEMDFFDLFLFLGIVGFVVYFILLFNTLFRFSLKKRFNLFFVFAFLSLAFMAGHFFAGVINAMYLCLFCMYLRQTSQPVAPA